METNITNSSNKYIIYFDGVCGLCNGFIDFIIRIDKKNIFKFATLQGKAAQKLPIQDSLNLTSIYYQENGKLYMKSTAVLKVFYRCGGRWKLMIIFWLAPKFFRDMVYDFVAKNRYKWFGKEESCRIPTSEELKKFLD